MFRRARRRVRRSVDHQNTGIGLPGTFTADGVLCPEGTTRDVGFTSGSDPVAVSHVHKTFVCTDGSGTVHP